jgi:hypothetical protein
MPAHRLVQAGHNRAQKMIRANPGRRLVATGPMSALGEERSFRPGQPNVRYAPKSHIQLISAAAKLR